MMEQVDPLRERFEDEPYHEEPEDEYGDVLQAQRRISKRYIQSNHRSRLQQQQQQQQQQQPPPHQQQSPYLQEQGHTHYDPQHHQQQDQQQTNNNYFEGIHPDHETSPFYCPPVQRQLWGDKQVLPHVDWHDIFFDLLFVAAAYNLGAMLISAMNEKDWPRGVIYFVGIFGGLYMIWEHDTIYAARYTVVDYAHRIVSIARFLCVSAAVLSIKPLELLGDKHSAETFVLTASLFFESLLQLGEDLELLWYGEGDHTAIRNQSLREIGWIVLPLNVVYAVAAILSGYHYFSYTEEEDHEEEHDTSADSEHNATEGEEHEDGGGIDVEEEVDNPIEGNTTGTSGDEDVEGGELIQDEGLENIDHNSTNSTADLLPNSTTFSNNSTDLLDLNSTRLSQNIFADNPNSSEGLERFLSALPPGLHPSFNTTSCGKHRFLNETATGFESSQYGSAKAADSPYTMPNYFYGWSVDDVPLMLCMSIYILNTLSSLYRRSTYKKRVHDVRQYFVPSNVDYMIHRYGEWVMLMIGEAVLSLLIVETIEATDYYSIALFGGLTVIMVQLLKYESEPHNAHEHALWRSLKVAKIYSILTQIMSMGLVGFGVAYKLMLNDVLFHQKHLYDDDADADADSHRRLAASYPLPTEEAETWLFCISLFTVLLSIEAMLVAHRGVRQTGRLHFMADGSLNAGMIITTILKLILFACTGTLGLWFKDPMKVTIVGFLIVSSFAVVQIAGWSFVDNWEDGNHGSSGQSVYNFHKWGMEPENHDNITNVKRQSARPSVRLSMQGQEDNEINRHSNRQRIQNKYRHRTNDPYAVADDDDYDYQVELDLTMRAYDTISRRNEDLKAALLIARDKVRKLKQDRRDLKKQLSIAYSHQSSTSTSNIIRSHELT